MDRVVAVVMVAWLESLALGAVAFEARSHAVAAGLGDERVAHRFEFVNAGDEPVMIAELRTSCGCTSATVAKRRYEPGEAGEVEVVFAFGDRVGPQRKRVEVRCSDDRSPLHFELAF